MQATPKAVPKVSREQKRELIKLVNPLLEDARHDPVTFCEYVLRHTKTNKHIALTPMQVEWHGLITAHKRTLLLSHPESGKSQLLTVGRLLWELGRNPALACVIMSSTDAAAKRLLQEMKRYIENSAALHEVFPNMRPAGNAAWTSEMLYLQRLTEAPEPSVQAYGMGSSPIGLRLDRLVFDDILSQENTSSAAEMERIEGKIDSSDINGRLMEDSKWWVVGNAWTQNDVYQKLSERPGWYCARYPVMDEESGQLFFPQQWSAKRIQEQRDNLHPLEFARQMLCLPRDDASSRFQKAWIDRAIHYGKDFTTAIEMPIGWYPPQGFRMITGVDLSVGKMKTKGDLTALVTILVHPDEDRQIVMVESGRWQFPDIISKIIDTHRRYKSTFYVESVGAQEYVLQELRRRAKWIHVNPYQTSVRTFKDPEMGIDGMAAEFAHDQWIIPSQGGVQPEISRLIEEMLFYDPNDHPGDRLMGLFFAREGARIAKRKGIIRPLDLTTR